MWGMVIVFAFVMVSLELNKAKADEASITPKEFGEAIVAVPGKVSNFAQSEWQKTKDSQADALGPRGEGGAPQHHRTLIAARQGSWWSLKKNKRLVLMIRKQTWCARPRARRALRFPQTCAALPFGSIASATKPRDQKARGAVAGRGVCGLSAS